MNARVSVATPDDTVQQATRLMRDENTDVLAVGDGDRLIGLVTEHDVAMRLVAEGKDPVQTKVREVMSQEAKFVFDDQGLADAAHDMVEHRASRLPVLSRDKRIVGLVSAGDLPNSSGKSEAA
jgi:CBS domain-containing protein